MTDDILAKLQDSSNSTERRLNFLTARKMINKFLSCDRLEKREVRCKRYTLQGLANKLEVEQSELKPFIRGTCDKFCYKKYAGKIDLRLIKLYCSTKWFGI